jgi:hypothetical protein
MTPKEKALELYNKMEVDVNDYESNHPSYSQKQAIECALICVDEILNTLIHFELTAGIFIIEEYWEDVKNELKLLK